MLLRGEVTIDGWNKREYIECATPLATLVGTSGSDLLRLIATS